MRSNSVSSSTARRYARKPLVVSRIGTPATSAMYRLASQERSGRQKPHSELPPPST